MSKMTMSEAGLLGALKTKEVLRNRYYSNPKSCHFCCSVMPYEKRHNKYCNHSCAASYTNKGTVRNESSGSYKKKFCVHCDKETTNTKFCTYKCKADHAWAQRVRQMEESGKLIPLNDDLYGYNPTVAKRYLAMKHGHKCDICGGEEWQGQPMPLVLDHHNGDPEDHRLNNLRLVCGNCNMQLPTFAGRNFGKGRKKRRSIKPL